MSKHMSIVALAVTLCISTSASQANANLISNPSFESPVLGAPFYAIYTTGNVSLAPWTIVGEVEHVNVGIYGPAQSGAQWLSLESFSASSPPANAGTVSQTFPTTVGKLYEGSFYYAALSSGGTLLWTMTYDYGAGAIPLNINETGTPAVTTTPWVLETFSFVATGPTSTLSFTGQAQLVGFYGPAIDNVSVELVPVPEPSTLMLLGLGVIGLAVNVRRRRIAA